MVFVPLRNKKYVTNIVLFFLGSKQVLLAKHVSPRNLITEINNKHAEKYFDSCGGVRV